MCCENLLVYHLSSLCYADTSFLGAHYRCLHHQLFIESVLSNVSALDYDAAMADDYVDEWRKAAKKEVEQLEAHGTWVLDEVSNATSRILPGTWAFKLKRDPEHGSRWPTRWFISSQPLVGFCVACFSNLACRFRLNRRGSSCEISSS